MTPVIMHPDDAEAVKCPVCGLYPSAFTYLDSYAAPGYREIEYVCKQGHRWRWSDIMPKDGDWR